MPLTVAEALKLEVFRDARLVSGGSGIYNEINWVNILEILDDLTHLQKGEFLITTAYGFKKDDINYQQSIIKQMAFKGLAALAIQVGYYIHEIPNSFLKLADEYNIPLIELQPSVSFKEVTRALLNLLSSKEMLYYEYTSKIGRELTEAILDRKGFSTITRVLSKTIEHPIRVYNCIYQLIASSEKHIENEKSTDLSLLVKEGIMELINSLQTPYEVTGHEVKGIQAQLIIPIKANHEIYGYISALKDGRNFQKIDMAVLNHAASICALELLKEDNLLKTRSKMVTDLVAKLLSDIPPPSDIIQQQAEILGHNINSNYSVMVIDINTNRNKSKPETKYFQNLRKKMNKLLKLIIQQKQLSAIFSTFSEDFVLILSCSSDSHKFLVRLSECIHSEVKRYLPGIKLCIGIGSCHGNLLTVKKSYQEAKKALKIQKLCSDNKNNTFFYNDLGIYRLLIEINNVEVLESFYKDTIAKIVEYDKIHKTDLSKTLRVFLINLNLNKTAKKLFIHRHTLKYRLNKIYEITGINPIHASDQYILQTGIMVMDLLSSYKGIKPE